MFKTLSTLRWLFPIVVILFAGQVFGHGMSEADKAKALEASYWDFIELGASHMITGYDHLLFLFGVIFFLTNFKDIVKFITVFTIGHSITLVFATLYHIQANYFLVDAVIALTVIYKAFDNLDGFKKYLNVQSPNLLWMVFGFGLIHGFGLSTRLQMLPLAEEGLVLRILSFNVGVELGQIVALGIMLLLLSGWRKTASFAKFSKAANVVLMFAGFMLLLMQLHGYEHTAHPEEYTTPPSPVVQTQTLSEASPVVNPADWKDIITVTIPAGGDKEYKLMMAKAATFEYAWKTNQGDLFFDFHGEPKGDTTGYFKSFEEATKSQSSGSLTATFDGTHGWYWKNDNDLPVEVTLSVRGTYQRVDLASPEASTKAPQPAKTTHESID